MIDIERSKIEVLRQAIIDEAMTWMKTRYHHMGRVKGAGVDCLTFIVEVYERVGLVGHQEIPFYRPDFMKHNAEDTYLAGLLEHGREVEVPRPGDVAIFKWGRVHAHAGIIIEWPRLIHAEPGNGVTIARADRGRLLGREAKFISIFDGI